MPGDGGQPVDWEKERAERIARRNRTSSRILGWAVAVMLGYLAVDGLVAALGGHGRSATEPALVAVVCLAALAVMAVVWLRRRR